MAQFLIDDRFAEGPVIGRIPEAMQPAAIGLWVSCGCWYARSGELSMTAGWIPGSLALRYADRVETIWALVQAELWEEDQGWFMRPKPVKGPPPADPIMRRNFPGVNVGGYKMRYGPDHYGSGYQMWSIKRDKPYRAAIPDWLRSAVYARDGNACLHCGSTADLSLDHIRPWSQGGPDTFENLQTLCRPCNSSKGTRTTVGAPRKASC